MTNFATCNSCIRCMDTVDALSEDHFLFPRTMSRMVLCPDCGNKRCPHASDHRLACTGSNDPGQPGSVYPDLFPALRKDPV